MPLFRRKPFPLVEPPKDLEPSDLVFQVRFTKEIFKDYQEYLNRINLYRERIWSCKVTAKTNLTYEEALVSEKNAAEKVQQFPKELMAPVLHMIQFSTLPLSDLVSTISKKLQEQLLEGLELYGRKDKSVSPCKILKVLEDGNDTHCEVGWMDEDKKVTDSSIVNADELIRKKPPFTREVLKSFIRESTSRSTPWVVHENIALKHGVGTTPPEALRKKISGSRRNIAQGETDKQKRKNENSEGLAGTKKTKKGDEEEEEPIKYPIDDLLVQPGADDPIFMDRPPPSRDFDVPMECVGDLLMVWDFCSSFNKLLNLWPFPLDDFENAICHKDSNLVLIVESHAAILRLLIKDEGDYYIAVQNKKRKLKITLVTWTEYLCDFMEMKDIAEFSTYIATVKRGHYGLLDPHAKMGIFRELVAEALKTNVVRKQLDDYIEQRQALGATKRELAIEEAKKRREEKLLKKSGANEVNKAVKGHCLENGGDELQIYENGSSNKQNGNVPKERNKEIIQYKRRKVSGNWDIDDVNTPLGIVKRRMEEKVSREAEREKPSKEEHIDSMRIKGKKKDAHEEISEEQRKEILERKMEKCFVRTNCLGKDKEYNRYWFFRRDGRIFVESSDSKLWGYYSSREELDALMGSLNLKGERERALHRQLKKFSERICSALQKSSNNIATTKDKEASGRRSTRIKAPKKDNPAKAFLEYVNKWKDN